MLSIQIGQCGNQMGIEFWSQLLMIPELAYAPASLSRTYSNFDSWLAVRNAFLHDDGTARMIAVDSEPKVVSHAYHMLHSLARATHALEPVPSLTRSSQSRSIFNNFICPGFGLTERLSTTARQPSNAWSNENPSKSANARPSNASSRCSSSTRRFPADALYYNPTNGDSLPKHVSPRFSRTSRLEPGAGLTFDDYKAVYGSGNRSSKDRDKPAASDKLNRQKSRRMRNNAGLDSNPESSLERDYHAAAFERRTDEITGHDSSFIFEQSGRGNNWALGYYGERARKGRSIAGGLVHDQDDDNLYNPANKEDSTTMPNRSVIPGSASEDILMDQHVKSERLRRSSTWGGVCEPHWQSHRGPDRVVFGPAGREAVLRQCGINANGSDGNNPKKGNPRIPGRPESARKGRTSTYYDIPGNLNSAPGPLGGFFDTDTSVSGVGARGRGLWGEGDAHSLSSLTLGSLRRHLERADRIDALLLFHSLAGGTGSGLGARLTVEVRDYIGPRKIMMNVAAAPLHAGEVVLQHYNVALSLASLYDATDALWLCSTDDILSALNAGKSISGINGKGASAAQGKNVKGVVVPGSAAVAVYQYLTSQSTSPSSATAANGMSSMPESRYAPSSLLSHTFPTIPSAGLQRDVQLLARMPQSLQGFAPVNAAIASTLIDFLAPNMRLSQAARQVCGNTSQSAAWTPYQVKPEPLDSRDDVDSRYTSADIHDDSEGTSFDYQRQGYILGGEHTNKPKTLSGTREGVVTLDDVKAASRTLAKAAIASDDASRGTLKEWLSVETPTKPKKNPAGRTPAKAEPLPNTDTASSSADMWGSLSWTPPWACISTQLRCQLMQLCPSNDTKLIELWNTAAMSATAPSTSVNAASNANASTNAESGTDVWRRHCDIISRALPRVLPSDTVPTRGAIPGSEPLINGSATARYSLAVESTLLSNAAAYETAASALLSDSETPGPLRSGNGRWLWATASVDSPRALASVFSKTLSASVTLHGAIPYRGEQSLPSDVTAEDAAYGAHGLLYNGVGLTRPHLTSYHRMPLRVPSGPDSAAPGASRVRPLSTLNPIFGEEDPLWSTVQASVARICPLPRWRTEPFATTASSYAATDAAPGALWSDEAFLFSLGQAPSFASYASKHAATYTSAVVDGLSKCADVKSSNSIEDSRRDSGVNTASVPRSEIQVLSRACEQINRVLTPVFPQSGAIQRPCAVTLGINRGRHAWMLGRTVQRAQQLLGVGAFTHWYERYGCTREEMASSVEYCGDIVEMYYEMLLD